MTKKNLDNRSSLQMANGLLLFTPNVVASRPRRMLEHAFSGSSQITKIASIACSAAQNQCFVSSELPSLHQSPRATTQSCVVLAISSKEKVKRWANYEFDENLSLSRKEYKTHLLNYKLSDDRFCRPFG